MEYGPAGWTRKLDQGKMGEAREGMKPRMAKGQMNIFVWKKKSQIWEVKI